MIELIVLVFYYFYETKCFTIGNGTLIQSAIINRPARGPVLLEHGHKGAGPRAGGWLNDSIRSPILQLLLETFNLSRFKTLIP